MSVHPIASRPRSRLSAFTLLEVLVVLVVGAVVLAVLARGLAAYDRSRRGAAWGAQMDEVVSALEGYGTRYRAQLVNGQPISGYANPFAPTIAELIGDSNGALLPPGFSAIPLPGGSYVISVTVTPTGCAPNNCDLQYWVYGTKSARRISSSDTDLELAATAAAAIRANRGGWSEGDAFRGVAGAWTMTNPTETAPGAGDGTAGLLGALASYRSGLLAQYLRVDGSNQMAADLNVGNNSIINAVNTNTQQVTFSTTATAGGTCTTANQITAGADGTPLVCLSGVWRRIGWRYVTAGSACTGTEIAADTSGQALVCRGSTFVALADRLPRVVDIDQVAFSNNGTLPKPSCGTGALAATYTVTLMDPGIDDGVPDGTASRNRMQVQVADAGSAWNFTLVLVDSAGATYSSGSGGAYNFQAIARSQCVYSS
jgi:prepilin-type N-terminal cleavage/methylation domain-containing protein